jgi:DNA-binding beta-propeller fold protein YncE
MRRIAAMLPLLFPVILLTLGCQSAHQPSDVLNIAPCHVIATSEKLPLPSGLALSADGDLYVAYLRFEKALLDTRIAVYDPAVIARANKLDAERLSQNYVLYKGTPVQPQRYINSVRLGQTMYAIALDGDNNLYVADPSVRQGMFDTGSDAAIRVFAPHASGFAKPIRILPGPNTHLRHPFGLALDASGRLYVANGGAFRRGPGVYRSSVLVFAAHANGDAAPMREIVGPNTALSAAHAIAVGSDGFLYVSGGHSLFGNPNTPYFINVYAPLATGDSAPVRRIAGDPVTSADFIDLETNWPAYVKKHHFENVMVFDPDTLLYELRNNPKLNAPVQMVFDGKGNLWVVNGGIWRVTEYAPNAAGNTRPLRVIEGDKTGLAEPSGIAVDRAGNVYVSNFASQVNEYCEPGK